MPKNKKTRIIPVERPAWLEGGHLVDIGANLSDRHFHDDVENVLQRAFEAGVEQIVLTGTSLRASKDALALATKYEGREDLPALYSTAGVHPHDAKHWTDHTAAVFEEMCQNKLVVAVGECGLDFDRNFSPHHDQEVAFEAQLKLAVKVGKPVFLHERSAHVRFAEILSRYADSLTGACVHCFTGEEASVLQRYLDMGCYIGITGWVTDERPGRGLGLQKVVSGIPMDRIMVETDSPYLTPRNIRPRPSRNEPAFLPHVVSQLAGFMGQDPAALATASTANALRFFRLASRAR